MLWSGCDTSDPLDDTDGEDESLRQVSYDLEAQDNQGDLPEGVDGEVTFFELNDQQTLVTLELTEGTGLNRAHPAHIHNNDTTEGGQIEMYLSPIDGSGGGGTSARVLNQSFEDLINFDGYVNIHESVQNLENVISQGNIGENAEEADTSSFDVVDEVRSTSYDLNAQENDGTLVPNGVSGTAAFQELTEDSTLVTVALDSTTEAQVGHAVHLRNNSVSEGGSVQYYLSPIDGTDPRAQSSKIVEASYDSLATYDGYINVYESVANRDDVISQGNIGANANGN